MFAGEDGIGVWCTDQVKDMKFETWEDLIFGDYGDNEMCRDTIDGYVKSFEALIKKLKSYKVSEENCPSCAVSCKYKKAGKALHD